MFFITNKTTLRILGHRSLESKAPVTKDSLFQIGSITKIYTGLALLNLMEKGLLSLASPLKELLSNFQMKDPEAQEKATPWHLLTHTAGWQGDFFGQYGDSEKALENYCRDMANLPQLHPIGRHFSYCNSGFSLAGYLIEHLTHLPYEMAMKDLVFDRYQLPYSFFLERDVLQHEAAAGHSFDDRGNISLVAPWGIDRSAHPAGGITTNIEDLLAFARIHLQADGTLLKMQEEQFPVGTSFQATGLSWAIDYIGPYKVISHGGATHGYTSYLLLCPEKQLAIASLSNMSVPKANLFFLNKILQHILGADLTKELPDKIPLDKEAFREYIGNFTSGFIDIDVFLADRELNLQSRQIMGFPFPDSPKPPPHPPQIIVFYGRDQFYLKLEPGFEQRGVFHRNSLGQVEWLQLGSRIFRKRVSQGDPF